MREGSLHLELPLMAAITFWISPNTTLVRGRGPISEVLGLAILSCQVCTSDTASEAPALGTPSCNSTELLAAIICQGHHLTVTETLEDKAALSRSLFPRFEASARFFHHFSPSPWPCYPAMSLSTMLLPIFPTPCPRWTVCWKRRAQE